MSTGTELRAPFFEAALTLLAAGGYAALKQAAVCQAVGVTTGSFYHSFSNWRTFTEQLLEHWRRERTLRIVELTEEQADPLARLLLLVDEAVALPHRAEAAIRVWSTLDPDVGAVQAEVDAERHRVVRDSLARMLRDEAEADRRAAAGMFLLVGFEQQEGADPAHLRWALNLLLQDLMPAGG